MPSALYHDLDRHKSFKQLLKTVFSEKTFDFIIVYKTSLVQTFHFVTLCV